MKNLEGINIPKEYLPKFNWVRDIQYFDGPLLSEYVTDSNEIYAFYWCDCSDVYHRWLAVRVTKRSLLELISGLVSIYDFLIKRSQEPNLYVLDFDSDGEVGNSQLVNINNIPNSYLPEKDEIIDPVLFEDYDKDIYPVLIDGKWETEELAYIPRKFIDLYSLLQNYKKPKKTTSEKMVDMPWKGGFSAVNFYYYLRSSLLIKPEIKAIQYASPGYIEFFADRETSLIIKRNIDRYLSNKEIIDTVYSNLSKYIKDEEFNKMETVFLTKEQEESLMQFSKNLLEHFTDPTWEWVLDNSSDVFKATKISRSYCKRIMDISSFILSERLVFAEI